jgi:tRNA threonylcarbamoyl adenosine modification protein YjeE
MIVPLGSLRSTRALAHRLTKTLHGRELLLLGGDLGAGKTTFVRYLAGALGIAQGWVSSPSFTLVQRYPSGGRGIAITHVDLYRIARSGDLESLGLEEILASEDLVVIEWPVVAEALWKQSGRRVIRIEFRRSKEGMREARVDEERKGAMRDEN